MEREPNKNSHEPLVYLADLPDCVVEHPLQQLKGEIVEGGGLWVSRDLTDFERRYVFICASWEAYKSNKCYFMSGARNPKVAERQKYIYPNIFSSAYSIWRKKRTIFPPP